MVAAGKSIAIILKGYPRLSETFIAQEIHALEQAGVAVTIFSLRRPTDKHIHPIHQRIRAPIIYLPEYLHRAPLRVMRAWWRSRRTANYRAALKIFMRDLRCDISHNRIRRFGQALVLFNELPAGIKFIYAHFLHTPASVAMYAAAIKQIKWSCSAHAKDIWTLPEWEMRKKIENCNWITTCTHTNFLHLRAHAKDENKIYLNYHGLDLTRIPQPVRARNQRDGDAAKDPVQILSVGRAVAKKGYGELLNALAGLPKELHWEFHHIGAGELLKRLAKQAQSLGISARIKFHGAQPQQQVFAAYRNADLFILNSNIAADGDRDGLPNVLMEAMHQNLAVVATAVSGIAELVNADQNGILVAPGDTSALTDALKKLIRDYELRDALGIAGAKTVADKFAFAKTFPPLHKLIMQS